MRAKHWLAMAGMLSLAVAMLAVFLPATAGAADSVGGGTAVTSSGLVASGWAGKFTITLVVPSGSTTGASTVSGVDFSHPWASLFELGTESPLNGVGHTAACPTVVTNPTSFSAGYQAANYPPPPAQWVNQPSMGHWSGPPEPTSGIYFDVACNDGAGYDFYRVQWDDVSGAPYPAGQPWPLFPTTFGELFSGGGTFYWGSSVQDGGYRGTLSVPFDNNAGEAAGITVYGHNASGFHFVTGGSGGVVPQGGDITTTVLGD
jgi:hypothetical protein